MPGPNNLPAGSENSVDPISLSEWAEILADEDPNYAGHALGLLGVEDKDVAADLMGTVQDLIVRDRVARERPFRLHAPSLLTESLKPEPISPYMPGLQLGLGLKLGMGIGKLMQWFAEKQPVQQASIAFGGAIVSYGVYEMLSTADGSGEVGLRPIGAFITGAAFIAIANRPNS